MADRPLVSVHEILVAAARLKARRHHAQALRAADRALAACLRRALWVREGQEGPAPACEPGLLALAEEYARTYEDAIGQWARALTLQGLPMSAVVCWQLARAARKRTLH